MLLRIGDKVSFLNEKLDGVVTKILNKTSVEVTTTDGFGIPALITQLVKVGGDDATDNEKERKEAFVSITRKAESMEEGAYLAFAPRDNAFELFLINFEKNRKFFVVRVFKKGDWVNIFSGDIGKNSFQFIGNFEGTDLEQFSQVNIDSLVTEFSLKSTIAPQSNVVKVKPVKLHKSSSFVYNSVLDRPAMLVALDLEEISEEEVHQAIKEHVEDLHPSALEQVKRQKNGPKIVGKIDLNALQSSKKTTAEDVIDLHIEKINPQMVDHPNGEIVQFQIKYARDKVDRAILVGKPEIVLIHGVGNGTLKTEIRKLLKGYYGIRFEDADFRKYGQGATLVYLKK